MSELTAAEEVLLAAARLSSNTNKEFTEWELTVETWSLNKNRWGLRGYESVYPDHKRVMNEVMAKGTQKVVGKGLLERTHQNHYRLTPAGLAKAASLFGAEISPRIRTIKEYDAVFPYAVHKVFEKYCLNPEEPKTWLGASAFLGLASNEPEELERRLNSIKNSIESALTWLEINNQNELRRDDSSRPITKQQLLKLKIFISELENRFRLQFSAIRAKKNQ